MFMKVNIVTFSLAGGAGKVASALNVGFAQNHAEVNLIYGIANDLRTSPMTHPRLTFLAALDHYGMKRSSWNSLFSIARDRYQTHQKSLPEADLTIFRWMNGMLGDLNDLDLSELGSLAWGLDDMNVFTGGCHHSGTCNGFKGDCSSCPALRPGFKGCAEKKLKHKRELAKTHQFMYVAPTDWINAEFRESTIGCDQNSVKILNPLQPEFFSDQTFDKSSGKKTRLLIVAADLNDPTKGVWRVLEPINEFLNSSRTEITFIGKYSKKLASSVPGAYFLGPLKTEGVMKQMRQHDALLVPSLFENAGTVVAEAASQGLPTIARAVGGMPEMTNYGQTGYLFRTNDELDEILDSLSTTELSSKGALAKDWAQQLKPQLIAAKYAEALL